MDGEYSQSLRNLVAKELGDGDKPVDTGIGIWCIIGIIYFFGVVYLLYNRIILDINEDIVYLVEAKWGEHASQITYCLINNLGVFILSIIAIFHKQSDLGVSVSLGIDMYNIGLLYGIILLKVTLAKKKSLLEGINRPLNRNQLNLCKFRANVIKLLGRYLDGWLFLRDLSYYILGLGGLICFLYLKDIYWWMSLILFVYSIVFFIVIIKNEIIKNKIYRFIGLTHEDDSFNADDLIKQKKRAISIEVLVQNKFIDKNADDLKRRIAKNEGLVIMKHGNKEDKQAKIIMKFHQAVYTIMFAIRNKHKYEKEQRSKLYADLWSQDREEIDQVQNLSDRDDNILSPDNNEMGENKQFIENVQPLKQAQTPNVQDLVEENKSDKESKVSQKEINPNQDPVSSANGDNEDEDEDSEDEQNQITLAFPKDIIGRISYIIYFPFHLLIYFLRSYHIEPSLMKLLRSFVISTILLGGNLYLIEWWTYEVSIFLDVPIQIIGEIFIAFGLNLPYMMFSLKIAKKEDQNVQFLQQFIELGIQKIGFCIAFPWTLKCLIKLQSKTSWITVDGLSHSTSIYGSLILCMIIFIISNKFKLSKGFASLLFISGVLFFGLSILSILLKL